MVQDLIRVGIADTGEDVRVDEGSFEGMAMGAQGAIEVSECGGEDLEATGVERRKSAVAADDVQGSSPLAAGLGEQQRAGVEVEGGQPPATGKLGADLAPLETPGDHEVQDQVKIVVEGKDEPLT